MAAKVIDLGTLNMQSPSSGYYDLMHIPWHFVHYSNMVCSLSINHAHNILQGISFS